MKAVPDTNILIASLISHGTCFELLEYCIKYHTLFTSPYIMNEFREKLVTKFKYPDPVAGEATTLLFSRFTVVDPKPDPTVTFEDADDIPVLQTCLAAQCDLLITGDRRLQELGTYRTVRIVSPAEFWTIG